MTVRLIAAFFSFLIVTVCASASAEDLCIPTTGKDVCGVPAAALFSRYDQLYGKKVSTYLYLSYEGEGRAALSLHQGDPQRSDHYSCVLVLTSDATYSGAYEKKDMEPGDYYVRVTGELVDSRSSGVCIGSLENADLYIVSRLDEAK